MVYCLAYQRSRSLNYSVYKILGIGKFSHITPALYELHWLPVSLRIDYKILLLTFKCIYGLAPTYLSDLISIKSNSLYNLRSTGKLLLDHPKGIGSKIILSSKSHNIMALVSSSFETLQWPTCGASSSDIT